MRIDVHTHAFHDKIAKKAVAHLENHYGILPLGSGRVDDLLQRARKAGLDKVVVHSAATDASQVIPANNWAISMQQKFPEIIAFGTLHIDYQEPEKEIERLLRNHITGLKMHCDFQGFFMDDPRFVEMLELAVDKFTFMFHVGDVLPPAENPSCPIKFAKLMRRFPGARFIAAHMGGYQHWRWALDTIVGTEAYIDTSSTLDYIDDATLAAIWNRHSRERILFGSDYPLFDPGEEAAKLQKRLHLSDSELDEVICNGTHLFE